MPPGGFSSLNCPKFSKICRFLYILYACQAFLKQVLIITTNIITEKRFCRFFIALWWFVRKYFGKSCVRNFLSIFFVFLWCKKRRCIQTVLETKLLKNSFWKPNFDALQIPCHMCVQFTMCVVGAHEAYRGNLDSSSAYSSTKKALPQVFSWLIFDIFWTAFL